jgi:hypothetical protein
MPYRPAILVPLCGPAEAIEAKRPTQSLTLTAGFEPGTPDHLSETQVSYYTTAAPILYFDVLRQISRFLMSSSSNLPILATLVRPTFGKLGEKWCTERTEI